MNIDEVLSSAAEDVGRLARSEPPDTAAIRMSARRLRRHRMTGVALGVACLVVAAAVLAPRSAQLSGPQPTNPASRADLDGAVWADGIDVYVDGRLIGSRDAPYPRGNPTVSGLSIVRDGVVYTQSSRREGPCQPQVVKVMDWEGKTRVLGRRAVTSPIGDRLTNHVAWFDTHLDLVVMDASTGAEVARARHALPRLRPHCDNPIRSVTDSAVTFTVDSVVYTFNWTENTAPTHVAIDGGLLLDRARDLDAVGQDTGALDEAGESLVSLSFISGGKKKDVSGAVGVVTPWGAFSPDGRYYATSTASVNGRLVVFDSRTAEPLPVDLASKYLVANRGWGLRDTLMVGFRSRREDSSGPGPAPWRLAVCHVSKGTCGFATDTAGRPLQPGYPDFPQ